MWQFDRLAATAGPYPSIDVACSSAVAASVTHPPGALAVALVAVAALALPASADARASYCSPSGDTCLSVKRRGEVVLLRIGVVAGVASSYRLCVSAPDRSRSCRRFRLRRGRDLDTGEVRWSSRYPHRGPGTYRARWDLGGGFFPPLSFRIRSAQG